MHHVRARTSQRLTPSPAPACCLPQPPQATSGAVVREVARALVVLHTRLPGDQPLQRLLAMWGQPGLGSSARAALVSQLAGLADDPRVAQVLLAAAASADVEVAQAACCLPAKRSPASVAFAVQLLATLLQNSQSAVRVSGQALRPGGAAAHRMSVMCADSVWCTMTRGVGLSRAAVAVATVGKCQQVAGLPTAACCAELSHIR